VDLGEPSDFDLNSENDVPFPDLGYFGGSDLPETGFSGLSSFSGSGDRLHSPPPR